MKDVMKKLLNISLLVVLCFSALVFVGGKAEEDIRCYAYERVDGVYYACPGESVGIKVPYDPDVSGNINYSFSGCESMSVRGSWPNYSITIREPGEYHIVAKSNTPFLLDADYRFVVGHEYSDEYTVDVEPTCVDEGSKSIHCLRCDATKDTISIQANGHSWEENPTIDQEPTCTEEGAQSIHCSACDARKDEEAVAALGHDLIHHKEKAPYLDIGWLEYDTCSRCDYSTFEDPGGFGVWILGKELSHNYYSDERGAWTYDAQTNTLLICRDSDKDAGDIDIPCIYSTHDLVIDFAGNDFSFTCKRFSPEICIFVEGELTIKGGGELYIQSTSNTNFCAILSEKLVVDETELHIGLSGTTENGSSFTGVFAFDIDIQNNGLISLGAGTCDFFSGLVATDNGTININKGEVKLLYSSSGKYDACGIECGSLNLIDGKIYIQGNRPTEESDCIRGEIVQLVNGSLEAAAGSKGYSVNAERINITSNFDIKLHDSTNKRWRVVPVYYPSNSADIDNIVIKDIPNQEYDGSALQPAIEIGCGEFILPCGDGEPCSVEYENNIRIGQAKANVIFYDIFGNKLDSRSKKFYIEGHSYGSWKTIKTATYTETGMKERICSGCGHKEQASIPKLTRTSISKASITKIVNKTYTGKNLTQSPLVKLGNNSLKAGTDYKLSYKNNKAIGKATVTITGIGGYTGTVTRTFLVNPKGTSLTKVTRAKKGFTVKWKKQATQTSGYQIQYSTTSNFKSGNKTVTIAKNKTLSKKVSKLPAKKKYYVRVRTYKTVKGVKYYSGWSKVKAVTTKK